MNNGRTPIMVLPLRVHRVALSSIEVPGETGTPSQLYPVIGVWADLSPLDAAGVPPCDPSDTHLPVLAVVAAIPDPSNPTMVDVIVSPMGNVHHGDLQGDSAEDPQWLLRVPATCVGLTTVLSESVLQVRMVLIDGLSPEFPEQDAVTFAQARAVIFPDPVVTSGALQHVMGQQWLRPVEIAPTLGPLTAPTADLMRDMVWTLAAGIALSQERTWNRAVTFCAWAGQFAETDPENPRRRLAVSAQSLLTRSEGTSWFTPEGQMSYPGPMAPLIGAIEDRVNPLAYAAIARRMRFEDIVELVGFSSALLAVIASAAAAALRAVEFPDGSFDDHRPGEDERSASYLLAQWLGDPGAEPWWATRATTSLLLHHDTEILIDLLTPVSWASATNGVPVAGADDEAAPPLLFRWLHVLTEALVVSELSPAELVAALKRMDVVLPCLPDVEMVAVSLLTAHTTTHAQECRECAAVHEVLATSPDLSRTIRAAVGALPVLADVQAITNGHAVGGEQWSVQRNQYVAHWLHQSALAPAQSV